MPETEKITPYWFTFAFKSSGIVDSDLSKTESLAKLHEELTSIYGPEGYTVEDFHEATADEIAQYETWLADMMADANDTALALN